MKIFRKKGFTLAELLIVVAIIGVLVAISIPIFTSQLEKAREATDAANIRSQYAEVMAEAITDGGDVNGKDMFGAVELKQKKDEWQSTGLKENLEGVYGTNIVGEYPKAGGTAWVEYKDDKVILHYEGGSGNAGGSTGGSTGDGSGSLSGGSGTVLTGITSKPWPSETGQSLYVVKGDAISKNGSLYIETNVSDTITPNQDPETSQELGYHFAKITGTYLNNDDLVTVPGEATGWRAVGTISKYIYRGDIYVTEDGTQYVANADSSTQLPPTDSNNFWVKINQ